MDVRLGPLWQIALPSTDLMRHRDDTGTFGMIGIEEWMAFFKDPDGNVLALASRRAAVSQAE